MSVEKPELHPRNKHRGRYDFDQLSQENPELVKFIKRNAHQTNSIDFSNADAVKALNRALLKQYYAIKNWDIPTHYLCPPIPGRADYLHYIADLLGNSNNNKIPHGPSIRVLDIGTGANLIYPLIGQHDYGWHFVGTDIEPVAIANAQQIINANAGLSSTIELCLQHSPAAIFPGIIQQNDHFDITLCNPPFHASLEDANAGTRRKWQNLNMGNKNRAINKAPTLNFGGQASELYCAGGEEAFVNRIINESAQFANQCLWFTTLISKASNLPGVYRALKKTGALEVKTIEMAQGQKKSRFVAWTFLNKQQQNEWRKHYWQAIS